MFVNILTGDDKYSLLNRDNLKQPIQMQLSQKQRAFCHVFFAYLKSTLIFKNFQKKKDVLIADVFPILETPKNVVRYMSEKSRFRGPFEREHGKRAQTLLQSE